MYSFRRTSWYFLITFHSSGDNLVAFCGNLVELKTGKQCFELLSLLTGSYAGSDTECFKEWNCETGNFVSY